METNLFKSINLIRRGSGANLNLFRYAAMVIMLLTLGIGNAWAGGGSTTYYANLTISKSGATGNGKVYYATSNTKPGSETSGALKSAGSTTQNANQTYYWWVDVDPGYNVTLSGKITAGPATAATLSGNVACAQSSSSGSGTSYSATANIVAVTVNSVSPTSKDLAPTNPSIDYPFTVTFATSNLKTIALDLNKSPETADGKFSITSWALDGTNVVASGKFNGGGSYGGASRNNSTTVSLQSKASGSAAKTCTVTANFPALAFVDADVMDVYTTTNDATKTGTAEFNFNYGAADDFTSAPTFTHTSGAGAFTVVGDPVIEPNFAEGTCKVTVNYKFDPKGTAGTTKEELKITSVGGLVASATITGEAEAEATDDAKVIAADGETLIYQGDWATALGKANTAANAGCTLVILRDVSGLTAYQEVKNTFTLDLNGKKLTGKYNGTIIYVNSSGKTLTIKDTKTGGRVENINNAYSGIAYCVNVNAGNLILESGTLYCENKGASGRRAFGINQVAGTTITMNGGRVEGQGYNDTYGIYQASNKNNNTTFTMNGGEIYEEGYSNVYAICAYGKININAGTISAVATYSNCRGIHMTATSNATPANCYWGTLTMKGGTVNSTCTANADGTRYAYGVFFETANTAMGTATATDGSHANKASSTGTIENATINASTLGRYSYGVIAYGSYQSKTNTYDVIQIKNSTINSTAQYYYTYGVMATGDVNGTHGAVRAANIELTNCTVNATTTKNHTAYAVWATTFSNTVYKNAQPNYYGEYAGGATVTVNSGTYTATTGTTTAYAIGTSARAKTTYGSNSNVTAERTLGGNAEEVATLNIHGGKFIANAGTTTARAVSNGGNCTIDGGEFEATAGSTTADGIYTVSGKLKASGVKITASATSTVYGIRVDAANVPYNTDAAWTGFNYAGDAELNNLDVTVTARTGATAYGVYVNATAYQYTQSAYDTYMQGRIDAGKVTQANADIWAAVFPGNSSYAIGAKAVINGGTYTVSTATTSAYGVWMKEDQVAADKGAHAAPEASINNAKFIVTTNGTTTAYGVYSGGNVTIDGCDFTVQPKTTTAYGVYQYSNKATITNTKFDVKGTTTVYGLYANAAISGTHGWDYHGEFELGEGNDMTVAATGGNTSHVLTLIASKKNINVEGGSFNGDYANAASAHITGGSYKATATGTTSYVLNLSAEQVQNAVKAAPSCTIEGGKFWAKADGGTTGICTTNGVNGNILFKGGVYNVNTTLSKHIPEGYEEVPLASDRPEYTEGYRYEVDEEGFHGIDVCKIGSTKYKSLEEALQVVTSGQTIIMTANYVMATPGDYVLPSGAKLLVPYSGQTATKETSLEVVEGTSAATLNLKLTFGEGVHLVSQGVIECGAKQTGQGSSELTGQVYGSYGHIYLREGSSITVESGASLYAWGYVTGKGEIILKNGGKSYEMFQFGWYKGGNTTSDINSNKSNYKIFPMTDYSYQNIECPITYYPGSSAYGRVAVKPSSYSSMQTPSAMLVGTADNSMFKMTTAEASANTWVKKVYDPETDITNWIMNSGASISGISMNVGVNVNSADFYLPITSNFRITLNYGEMNINNDVIFLPGSQLIINKEATGILKSGKLLFFYDAEDWFTGLGHVSVQASGWSKAKTCGYYYYPATYSPTWGTTNPRKSVYARDKASLDKGVTPLPDAELFVHGKMIVNGSLYTSGDGNASSIGRNANIHSTNEDAGKIQFNTKVTGSKALYKVCFAIGASEANNSWSDMIYGGQTTAYPAHLTNGNGTYVQSSGTEAGKQYVYVDNQWQCWEENGCYTYDAQNHPYAKPAAYVQLTTDQPDANHLLHDASTGTRNFVWDQNCYWWEVVTTPTAEGYYQSINPDYNGKYNYYYYDSSAACWKIKKITITWNINGTNTDYSVGYGTKPEWLGATPTKTSSSSNYVWRWDGWTQGSSTEVIDNKELPIVTENTTFTAHFYEKYYEYNVTFKNSDGTILDSRNWRAGTTPSYEGTPTKNPTVDYTYEFNGSWSPAITTVTGSATYTAQYTQAPRAYTITFLNYDMSVLGTTKVDYNATPTTATYKAAIAPSDFEPYKPDNSAYSFNFSGWKLNGASSNGFAQVKGDQTYVAQFAETTKKYRISFVDEDGETVLHWTQLEYDAMPSYDGPATSGFNKQDAEWTYVFTGWNPATFSQVKGPQTYTAVYNKTKREYTITWKDGDGNTLKTDQVAYGSTPSYSGATPTKASTNDHSYVFNNTWSPAIVAVVGEATYTAQFNETPRQYRVTWDAATNGGTCGTEYSDFSYNAAIGTLPVATKEGHTFNGWFTSATGGTQITTATKVTADVTYHAQFTVNPYTITFDSNGGSSVASITQSYGTAVTAPADPSREGYTFDGWSPAVPSTMPVNGLTCVAQWTVNPYTITFDSNGGSSVASITQNYGTAVTAPADPSREGYTFNGWSPAVPSTMPVNGLTCVAQWTVNPYTITFDSNGGSSVASITQNYGTAVTAPADPSREGYTFNGWSPAVPSTMPVNGLTCVAQWTVNPYTITFDSNGGSSVASITQSYGTAVTAPADPSREGYTFDGWSPAVPSTMPVNGLTCVAQWTINQCLLTVLANNDTYGTVTGSGTYDYGTNVTITATPKSGFKFVKWNDDNTNASREVTVTADVTYTATFDYDIANYTVRHLQQNIYDDGYTEVASETKSGTIGEQTVAAAKTYTGFIAQPFNQQTIALENTEVNIYYNRETYTISWIVKLSGETVDSKEETLRYGATPSFGPDPTKEQDEQWVYSFSGWTPTIEAVTENQTYEGTFDATARTYDVTWNNMDGTLIAKEVSKYTWGVQPTFKGSDPTYSDGDPTKVYKFRGWKYERTGVEYKNDAVLPGVAGDETYTAVYTQMTAPIDVENGDTKEIETNTTTPTTTVHEGGMLKVQAGKALTTTTFILEASANASGQIIEDGTIEAEHVYYDLKLNSPRRHWHAFGVPWKVDLAANPLTEVETGRTFVLGNDYDIIWYNTTKRASSGPGAHCWEYVAHHDKTLTPGQGYMIAFTRDVQTIRFVKASGAPIIYNQEVTVTAEGEGNNQGINALANPMAYHATLNAGPAVGYVHDGGEIGSDGYEEYDIENKSYVVGKTVYIQVQSNTTVAIDQSDADPISKRYAPARRKVVTDKEYLSLNDYYRISISGAATDGGSVYVLPEDGKEDKYVVGHDLAKFGMSTKKAQIWIRRYDANLGLHTIAPIDGEAEFPINLYAPTTSEYTIANAFSPDDEYTVYLTRDGEAIWNLSDSPYTMTFNKGTVNGYGIRLAKKAPQIATGVDEAVVDAKGETRKVLVNDKVFIIRGDQVYSVDGQLVK